MNKRISTIFLIALFLSSCAEAEVAPTPTAVIEPVETSTRTPSPTEIPATPTEALPKEGDPYSVTENGYTYNYTLKNLGVDNKSGEPILQNVREGGVITLFDNYFGNFIPLTVRFSEGAPGERFLYALTHKDWTTADIPSGSGGVYDPPPITAAIGPVLRERYFSGDTRSFSNKEKQSVVVDEMLGQGEKGHEQAYLPIILSNGVEAKMKLSQGAGIIMTIMDKETLFKLGGEHVSTWTYGSISQNNIFTFYSEVYGVDKDGNALVRLALDGSFDDPKLTDEILRVALFTPVANLIEHEDQRGEQVFVSDFAITLGHVSSWTQADGVTKDLEIERVVTPTPTPTP